MPITKIRVDATAPTLDTCREQLAAFIGQQADLGFDGRSEGYVFEEDVNEPRDSGSRWSGRCTLYYDMQRPIRLKVAPSEQIEESLTDLSPIAELPTPNERATFELFGMRPQVSRAEYRRYGAGWMLDVSYSIATGADRLDARGGAFPVAIGGREQLYGVTFDEMLQRGQAWLDERIAEVAKNGATLIA